MVNTAMRADKGVHVRYLTSNSHTVCPIHSLDNAPNMLHGSHKRRELVLLEVCEAGDDACGDDKDICRSLRETPVRPRTLDEEQGTQTTRNDWLQVNDGGCETGAIKGLTSDIERGEKECRHDTVRVCWEPVPAVARARTRRERGRIRWMKT